jgi:hypothetical protein
MDVPMNRSAATAQLQIAATRRITVYLLTYRKPSTAASAEGVLLWTGGDDRPGLAKYRPYQARADVGCGYS